MIPPGTAHMCYVQTVNAEAYLCQFSPDTCNKLKLASAFLSAAAAAQEETDKEPAGFLAA